MDWLREKADALDADYEISQKAGALADAAAEKGDHLYAVSLCPCVSLLHSLSLLLSMVLSHSLVVSVGALADDAAEKAATLDDQHGIRRAEATIDSLLTQFLQPHGGTAADGCS